MSTSSAEERYDPLLLNIASTVHGIEELLDVFLGFLRRKSDAFNPPGGYSQLEEAFVASLKRQWDLGQAAKAKAKAAAAAQSRPAAAAASAASTATNKKAVPTSSQQVATPKPMSPVDDVLELTPDGFDASRTVTTAAATSIESTAEPQRTTQTTIPPPGGAVVAADTDSQAATASPLGNGGTTDRYSWTQTLGDVTVVFDVPPSTRSRDVVVDISTKRVKVALRGASSSLLEGALPKRIKAEDSFWTLDDGSKGKTLTLYLTKEAGMDWWASVADGEPAIDITKIQPENSKLSELDGDTRTTVEKMMFDQRQKSMGLPTSDELKKQDILANFMKQHPEMDFSKAKFT